MKHEWQEDIPNTSIELSLIRRAAANRLPVNGSLELTPLCSMDCGMCYVHLDRRSMEEQGRLRTAEEWLTLGRQMQQAGVLFLLLTGGEPLLYPEFRNVYLGLRQMGMILTINTNGTLIDEEWADFFAKYPPRRINVTIYGADAKTYDRVCHHANGYAQTIRGIQLLTERGLPVKAAQTVVRANFTDQERIFDLAQKFGIPCSCDAYLMPTTRERRRSFDFSERLHPKDASKARLTALRNQMSKPEFQKHVKKLLSVMENYTPENPPDPAMSCLAGSCSFTVNWQGNLRPCVMCTDPSIDVFEKGFAEAWEELREQVDTIRISPKCLRCNLRSLCHTCAMAALHETDRTDGVPEYLCQEAEQFAALLRRVRKEELDAEQNV